MSDEKKTSVSEKASHAWHACAVGTALVGAMFSALFLGWLARTTWLHYNEGPPKAEALLALKTDLIEDAKNTDLLDRIRALDLEIRQETALALQVARQSIYSLLASFVVFVVGIKWVAQTSPKLPIPQPAPPGTEQLRSARFSRVAIALGMVILCAGAGMLALTTPIALEPVAQAGDFIDINTVLPPPKRSDDLATDQIIAPKPVAVSYATDQDIQKNWHRFLGPNGAGTSAFTNIPTEWDGATDKHIRWKSEVPLPGHNSPIVWGDYVFCSGATNETVQVFCFSADSGELLWAGDVPVDPKVLAEFEVMEDTGLAANTMATDGVRAYAIFATGDLVAFDFSGTLLWQHSFGVPDSSYGYATSLECYQDRVLVQLDQASADDEKSVMIAFDGQNGDVVWEKSRPVHNGWTSPIVAQVGDTKQLITIGAPFVIGYDPNTGEELWRAECMDGDVAPSPIVANGLVLAIEPYSQMVAIRPDGRGNVTETHIVWRNEEGGADICTPVAANEYVYQLDGGELICDTLTDGSEVYRHDFEAMFHASPSIVGKHIYLLDTDGIMHIAPVGAEAPKEGEVTKCALGEACFASPAFTDGRIYIRSEKTLFCIEAKESAASAGPSDSAPPAYADDQAIEQNWHRFLGPAGAGISPLTDVPTEWDGATGKHIQWKCPVPLPGHNSPIVWGDRLFCSGATNEKIQVFCYSTDTGDLLWTGDVPVDKAVLAELDVMEDTGLAANTMATDGVRAYAIFATGDLVAFDFSGKLLWQHSFGVPDSSYGYATSLECYQDRVLVQLDQASADDGKSAMIAFDGQTGDVVWETPRPVHNGWASPIIAAVGDKKQLITVGAPFVIGYDPDSGKELWRAECVDGDVAPSPIVAGGLVLAIEPYSQMVAIRPDGQGDVTETHIVWCNEEGGTDICTPVATDEYVYQLDAGELICAKLSDGSEVFRHDLEAEFQASPSIVGDHFYLLDTDGVMHITPVGAEAPTEVRKCALGEPCFASPAFVGNRIYIRSKTTLFCIAN